MIQRRRMVSPSALSAFPFLDLDPVRY